MSFFNAKNISISFGGVRALNSISFSVVKGEVFAIIGPNGAGKTTIFNCINRYYNLDNGMFILNGKNITKVKSHVVADLGIARTFQNIELFKNMTVIDNLLLGRHRRRRSNLLTETLFLPSVQQQEIRSREKAEEIIDFLELQAFRDQIRRIVQDRIPRDLPERQPIELTAHAHRAPPLGPTLNTPATVDPLKLLKSARIVAQYAPDS